MTQTTLHKNSESLCQQVYVQLPTYADNVALPAFAHRCDNRSISLVCRAHSSKPATADLLPWAHAGTDRRTYGRTPYRFIDPAQIAMRSVPIILTTIRSPQLGAKWAIGVFSTNNSLCIESSISQTVQYRQLQWKTNLKTHMWPIDRLTPIPLTLGDIEGHRSCVNNWNLRNVLTTVFYTCT